MVKNRKVELSTIIGKDSVFKGELEVKGGLRIEGEVAGKISCDGFVTVGGSGYVESDIEAEECLISGQVKGNISARSAVELDKTSQLSGDISAQILKIHAGAIFNGTSSMPKENNEEQIQTELEK
ncbi:MAG: polymer-forming cytoskeletal protein [Candidatus Cloacimonadales bacterium]